MIPATEPRCYTVADVCARLKLTRRTFERLRHDGCLPFVEEIRPRLGRSPRYRADLVDKYLRGDWFDGVRALVRRSLSQ